MSGQMVAAGGTAVGLKGFLGFLGREFKPKGPIFTPFNVISVPIILLAGVLLVLRFAFGLGSITNLSQEFPWGIWIGFDVVTGVAFAGGAYVLTFMVYIMKVEKYHPIVRATVLNGFLAYVFYAGALLLDLGRPWNVINPIIGNSFGVSSVLFLVAWHFMLYMMAEFIEFSPAVAEWLGWKRVRKIMNSLTLGAVIFGITLSTLHQSGLGALFLMARDKIHPLWYTEFIPVLFFVSSVFAGLSLVIFEGSISHKVFHDRLGPVQKKSQDGILVGLGRICAGAMFVYVFLKILVLIHDKGWSHLGTGWGLWYLVEVIGFVVVPGVLFFIAARDRRVRMIQVAAALTLVGIILNRLNISVIAFQWFSPDHYVPSWQEIVVTLAVVLSEIWVFRWIVNRMPVLGDSPQWAREQDSAS
jgi:Ni/Fe-hydrogenase subunit HybB-like protein